MALLGRQISRLPNCFYRNIVALNFASKATKTGKKVSREPYKPPEPAKLEDIELNPELQKICKGANHFKEGEDPPILDDEAYPAWLWELDAPKKNLSQLEEGSRSYFRRLNKAKIKSSNMVKKQTGF